MTRRLVAHHATVPFPFQIQVSHQTQERSSKFLPTASGIQQGASWRTRAAPRVPPRRLNPPARAANPARRRSRPALPSCEHLPSAERLRPVRRVGRQRSPHVKRVHAASAGPPRRAQTRFAPDTPRGAILQRGTLELDVVSSRSCAGGRRPAGPAGRCGRGRRYRLRPAFGRRSTRFSADRGDDISGALLLHHNTTCPPAETDRSYPTERTESNSLRCFTVSFTHVSHARGSSKAGSVTVHDARARPPAVRRESSSQRWLPQHCRYST
jgi:hypothetical protein